MSSARKDPCIPTAASSWTRRTLKLLNVDYNYEEGFELLKSVVLPHDLQESSRQFITLLILEVCGIVHELEQVNNSEEITAKFDAVMDLPDSLRDFKRFHSGLAQLLARKPSRDDPTFAPKPRSTAANTTVTPPTQITQPSDPKYSSGAISASSSDSKREIATHEIANDFLFATLSSSDRLLRRYSWFGGGTLYQLQMEFVSFVIELIIRALAQRMKMQLGQTTVNAESDGGAHVIETEGLTCSYPVFCMEVIFSP